MDCRDLWAKSDPYHPLWCHLLDVGAVCRALLPRFGPIEPIPDDWVVYVAALHDLGKADPLFQNKDFELAAKLRTAGLNLPVVIEKFRHESRSAEWVLAHLKEEAVWGNRAAKVVAQAVRGHHGNFQATAYLEDDNSPQVVQWHRLREDLSKLVAGVLDLKPWSIPRFEDASATGARLSGLIVLSDWIASNDELYDYPSLGGAKELEAYFAAACAKATESVARLELDVPPETPVSDEPLQFRDVWPGLEPRGSQAALDQVCRGGVPAGLAMIEAPMGEGKTEAAIFLSEYWGRTAQRMGAYIALPTAATSNQMHSRYSDFLHKRGTGRSAPRLVHGMAWLMDDPTPITESQTFGDDDEDGLEGERVRSQEWFRPTKRALLAGEGVGTVDQALMAALRVKHGFLRLFGLSRKTLIIDEVHAYDEYMTVIMECLLQWCRTLRIPVILLSATLSRGQKERLAQAYSPTTSLLSVPEGGELYPLLTFAPLDGEARTVDVPRDPTRDRTVKLTYHSGLLEDPITTAALAASVTINGGCACVLCNTVGSAQAVFGALRRMKLQDPKPQDTELFLFHARFRAEVRQEIERKIVERFGKGANEYSQPLRPRRAILVATQVVEQSLDVDFDVMISQLAPIDLLLQRSGRLHRHERGPRSTGPDAVLHLLLPPENSLEYGGNGYVYHPEILHRTMIILDSRKAFFLPQDFRPLIEQCYGNEPLDLSGIEAGEMDKAAAFRRNKIADARKAALVHLAPEPKKDDFSLAAEPQQAVEESEEGERKDYFHAQTRLGDQTRSVLILNDPKLVALTGSEKPPSRDRLKYIFLQGASIPSWWLVGVEAAPGFGECVSGNGWLRGRFVIPMQERVWRGVKDGKPIAIVDDPVLGLVLQGREKEDADV